MLVTVGPMTRIRPGANHGVGAVAYAWTRDVEGGRVNVEVIDGIDCYAPDVARGEDGYPAQGFEITDALERSSFWVRSRNRLLIRLFDRFVANGRRPSVLEIGCGTGNFLGELSRSGDYELTGSEVHLAGLRFAVAKRPGIRFVQLDALRVPFRERFDAIGAFDVIEHIEDDVRVIENIRAALKPGGVAIISVPQYQFMWSELDELVHHKRRYSKADLVGKLSGAGFRVVFCTSFVFALFPAMLAKRLIGGRSPSRGSRKESLERHVKFPGFLNGLFDAIMRLDELLIAAGIALPFGGTLVVVARKE